jgi:hypothetical protein
VAVTHKLLVIMHTMWRDGSTFQFKGAAGAGLHRQTSASIAADGLFLAEGRTGALPTNYEKSTNRC